MNFKRQATIFGDDTLEKVDFRVKKFKVLNFPLGNMNFLHFLENFKDSIETFEMDNRGSTDLFAFLQKTNCKHLIFTGNFFLTKRLASVTKLTANFLFAQTNWHQNFPNLEELILRTDSQDFAPFVNFDLLTKLEKLTIHSMHFLHNQEIAIPSVKYLKLKNVSSDSQYIFQLSTAKTLREIEVDNSVTLWLVRYLNCDVKLKKLKISNTNLKPPLSKKILEKVGVTVEHVEMINVTENQLE